MTMLGKKFDASVITADKIDARTIKKGVFLKKKGKNGGYKMPSKVKCIYCNKNTGKIGVCEMCEQKLKDGVCPECDEELGVAKLEGSGFSATFITICRGCGATFSS